MKKDLILIDGRNFCYRHAYTRMGLTSKGRPTGAIFGALSGLIRLARLFPDACIVFCWDGRGARKSWRHKLFPEYKGNRRLQLGQKVDPVKEKEKQGIQMQIEVVTKFIHKMGFRNFTVPKFEADDLIGVLATALKDDYNKVIIYSTDKDYFQLIRDNIVVVRDQDKKKNCLEITKKELKKTYGVYPKHWLNFRSLTGDSGDNIKKPIPGIGEKKAIDLLKAGFDPSSSKPFKTEKVDYAIHWPKVQLAYNLSKIVRKVDDKRVPLIARKSLRIILKEVKASPLHRLASSKTKKTYKYMMAFLQEWQLLDIIERRDQLWKIK